MVELPPALRPWAPWLEGLIPELRVAVGEAVRRLDRALGPMPPRPEPGRTEPTGLDGLTRRGPYERLLLSEWALADEVPDEFLRRAAASEHLFHELSRVVPKGGRITAVLFDAGPLQLGGPRLAHLALLVAFSRRAEAAGATLVWGVLQGRQPEEGGLRALLAARSLRSAAGEDLARWEGLLGPAGPADERWIVGGRATPGGPERVVVEESVEEEALDVEVRRRGRPPTRVALPLPDAATRTRWIRDPFSVRPTPESRPRTRGGHQRRDTLGPLRPFLRFSPDGNRLLAIAESGSLVGFRLPEGGEERPPRVLAPAVAGSVPLGIGWIGGSVIGLFQRPDGTVTAEGKRVWGTWTGHPARPDAEPGVLLAWSDGRLVFLDADDNLHVRGFDGSSRPGRTDAVAIGRRDGHLVVVLHDGKGMLRVAGGADVGLGSNPAYPGLGLSRRADRAILGPLVLFEAADTWVVGAEEAPRQRSGRAVGVCATRTARGVASLRGGDLWFQWLWPDVQPEVRVAVGPLAVTCSPAHYGTLVSWLASDGRIVVWDAASAETVAWWDPA